LPTNRLLGAVDGGAGFVRVPDPRLLVCLCDVDARDDELV
jgi:hypothetical protein